MRFIPVFLFLTLLACALPCLAGMEAEAELSVESAVALAVRANPRAQATIRDILAARSGLRSAKALVNPTFVVAPSVPNANGAPDALLLSQPLELNGTRSARAGIAAAQLRLAQARGLSNLRALVFEVKSAYYELARSRQLLSLAQEMRRTADEFDRVARRQVELGKRPGIELAQTGIEASRASQQVAVAESRVAVATIALNTLLNRRPDELIGRLPALPDSTNPGTKETLLQQALTNRAEIAMEDALRQSFEQEARLAKAEGHPDIAPTVRFNEIVRNITPQEYGLSLAVSLPLFDWGSRRERIRQAEQSALAQSDRVTAARSQVRQEVEQIWARLTGAEMLVREYRQGVLERAKRLHDASIIGLQEGQTTLVALLEAQRTYRNVLTEYANAQADYALILAELERAVGSVPASLLPETLSDSRRSK